MKKKSSVLTEVKLNEISAGLQHIPRKSVMHFEQETNMQFVCFIRLGVEGMH
jgi:hypothetical protein